MKVGFFVTGTDTDVGKTYVSGCIGHTLTQLGIPVSPRKPIASGCIPQADNSLYCEDATFLKLACHSKEPIERICPHQFIPPVSPQRALQQAGITLKTEDLAEACQVDDEKIALVEGAGGFYSPLSSDGLNSDLAKQLRYPVILVVGNRLGCLNHALLTIDAIEHAGLSLHCVIVNDIAPEADQANFEDIKRLLADKNVECYHLAFNPAKQPVTIEKFRI